MALTRSRGSRGGRIGAIAAAVLIGITACTTHATNTRTSSPAPSPTTDTAPISSSSVSTAPASSAVRLGPAPHVTLHWTIHPTANGGALGLAVGASHLWIAYGRPTQPNQEKRGELVGYNLGTGHADVVASIGGAPDAVAVTDSAVFVANGIGDGSPPVPYAVNTVQKFTTRGKLLASVPINNPLALAASGTNVWVYYTRVQSPYVKDLDFGGHSPTVVSDTALPGQPAAGFFGPYPLVTCGGQIDAVSADLGSGKTVISELGTRPARVITLPTIADPPSLACGNDDTLELLAQNAATAAAFTSSVNSWRLSSLSTSASSEIVGGGGPSWFVSPGRDAMTIQTLSNTGELTSRELTEPGSVQPLLAATGDALWLVTPTYSPTYLSIGVERIVP